VPTEADLQEDVNVAETQATGNVERAPDRGPDVMQGRREEESWRRGHGIESVSQHVSP